MKIIIVANKWWEAVPLVNVFQHVNNQQAAASAAPIKLCEACQPGLGGASLPKPRLRARCNDVNIEVWCIQDLMDSDENSSLTFEKVRVLPRIVRVKEEEPLVIAFGTAACPTGSARNGNVVIGSSVFVHDPYKVPPDPQKHWKHAQFEQTVTSDFQPSFEKLPKQFVAEAEKRLLAPSIEPAVPPRIRAESDLVAVGVVNVTNSADYAWTDRQALEKFKQVTGTVLTESLETTHGVIRLVLGPRFLYVSGIANAVGEFQTQVGQRPYSQSFVAAHNAAIGLAWLLPEIAMSR
jgi:hypothetical protein